MNDELHLSLGLTVKGWIRLSEGGSTMGMHRTFAGIERRKFLAAIGAALPAFLIGSRVVDAQNQSGFPDGFDAVQAAPDSHRVIFENSLVRVLEVTVPPPGTTEPMHHHRWPSFFLDWNTGGCTPHVRYHRGDGTVMDQPSHCKPIHAGVWGVKWMKPEPMHAIETVENQQAAAYRAGKPPLLRVEIKCRL